MSYGFVWNPVHSLKAHEKSQTKDDFLCLFLQKVHLLYAYPPHPSYFLSLHCFKAFPPSSCFINTVTHTTGTGIATLERVGKIAIHIRVSCGLGGNLVILGITEMCWFGFGSGSHFSFWFGSGSFSEFYQILWHKKCKYILKFFRIWIRQNDMDPRIRIRHNWYFVQELILRAIDGFN